VAGLITNGGRGLFCPLLAVDVAFPITHCQHLECRFELLGVVENRAGTRPGAQ